MNETDYRTDVARTVLSSHAARAHAASASAIVVAKRALDSDGDDDDVGVVWALDQLSHAMCVVPDMNMFMLDMSCAPPSQFIATECSIALASAASLVPAIYIYL